MRGDHYECNYGRRKWWIDVYSALQCIKTLHNRYGKDLESETQMAFSDTVAAAAIQNSTLQWEAGRQTTKERDKLWAWHKNKKNKKNAMPNWIEYKRNLWRAPVDAWNYNCKQTLTHRTPKSFSLFFFFKYNFYKRNNRRRTTMEWN